MMSRDVTVAQREKKGVLTALLTMLPASKSFINQVTPEEVGRLVGCTDPDFERSDDAAQPVMLLAKSGEEQILHVLVFHLESRGLVRGGAFLCPAATWAIDCSDFLGLNAERTGVPLRVNLIFCLTPEQDTLEARAAITMHLSHRHFILQFHWSVAPSNIYPTDCCLNLGFLCFRTTHMFFELLIGG